jgi:serine phosphatase RsbU (regulator of sigma subunit)
LLKGAGQPDEKDIMQAVVPQEQQINSASPPLGVLMVSSAATLPDSLIQAAQRLGREVYFCPPEKGTQQLEKLAQTTLVVLVLEKAEELKAEAWRCFKRSLRQNPVSVLIFSASDDETEIQDFELPYLFVYVNRDESCETLQGRLATLFDLQPTIQGLLEEMERLRLVSQPLGEHFNQVGEEMRLASRLQRDFLPRELPQIEGLRFATIFRPATWVSGDIYDVMRLDEEHIGFYLADAVGHGMPAALLTMFIKHALVMKRVEGNSYTLIEPGAALEQLNGDMVQQELNNFQFATCCYGLLNTRSRQLRVANAGHPPPLVINRAGQMKEVDITGSLLGVFPELTYETKTVQLHPGDKLVLYSDGVEHAFESNGPDEPLRFRQECDDLGNRDIQTMCEKLVEIINHQEGSLHPRDDVTIVGIEFETE